RACPISRFGNRRQTQRLTDLTTTVQPFRRPHFTVVLGPLSDYLYGSTTALMYLIFDTETTGIPHNKTAPIEDLDNWPRVVQLAWQLHDNKGRLLSQHNYI